MNNVFARLTLLQAFYGTIRSRLEERLGDGLHTI